MPNPGDSSFRQMPTPSSESKLAGQLRDALHAEIRTNWLQDAGEPSVRVEASELTGATDAVIFEVNASIRLFLKLHLRDAAKEKKGFEILRDAGGKRGKAGPLAPHLVGPIFPAASEAVMLVPFANAVTFHDLVRTGRTSARFLADLYRDFLSRSSEVWITTKKRSSHGVDALYVARVTSRLERLATVLKVPNASDLELIVNGEEKGTIRDLVERLRTRLSGVKPRTVCTIHGDEHPKNLMVQAGAAMPSDWRLIDYVNVRTEGDWVFSIAKIVHWWELYYVLEAAKSSESIRSALRSTMSRRGNVLRLDYSPKALDKYRPTIGRTLTRAAMETLVDVASAFDEDERDTRRRLRLALFSVVFGSAPLHSGPTQFALPVMIGESIKYLQAR